MSTSPSTDHPSRPQTSKKVTDHLANERTFLAWIRTSLATMAFGFVIERFGLLLRELEIINVLPRKGNNLPYIPSTWFGISLMILGVLLMIIALNRFWHTQKAIDLEQFQPQARYPLLVTVLICVMGILIVGYLLFTL